MTSFRHIKYFIGNKFYQSRGLRCEVRSGDSEGARAAPRISETLFSLGTAFHAGITRKTLSPRTVIRPHVSSLLALCLKALNISSRERADSLRRYFATFNTRMRAAIVTFMGDNNVLDSDIFCGRGSSFVSRI